MTFRLSRRTVLSGLVASTALGADTGAGAPAVTVDGVSLSTLADAMSAGTLTSKQLVEAYLERIERIDRAGPTLRAVLETNPDALSIAEALDAERAQKGVRGPLHGMPVLVKDNLDTADRMHTTAGSRALLDAPTPKRDAFVVQRLREAGAVILGKANLSEWANGRGHNSSSGWSGVGGQTRNPHVLDRSPIGSSSGSAVAAAASLCAAAIGTETDGSIVSPASACGVVGFKPTVGLVSRSGIIPLSHTQDTAGPMTRSVLDAALVLDAIVGVDPRDAATSVKHPELKGFAAALSAATLKGKRLGLVKNLVTEHHRVRPLVEQTVEQLQQAGAIVVPLELTSKAVDDAELEVLLHEVKADINAYLAERGGPMKDLAAVIAYNQAHPAEELPFFGQEDFVAAQAKGPLSHPAYKKALATCGAMLRELTALTKKHGLDAFAAPTASPAGLIDTVNGERMVFGASTYAAVARSPHVTVPMGFVEKLPVGFGFFGLPWTDVQMLQLGHAFETLVHARRAPAFLPTMG